MVTPATHDPDRARHADDRRTAPSTTRIPTAPLTVAQVIQKSSNIGAAKIALAHAARRRCGMFYRASASAPRPQLGFPGEAAGQAARRARPGGRSSRRRCPTATASRVSLLQLARAYTVFASDGELVPLTLVKTRRGGGRASRCSRAETARAVRAHAGAGGAARRHRRRAPHHGLSRRRQDRHRAQAGERRLRRATSTSRPSSASRPRQRPAPDRRGDDRRAPPAQYYGGEVAAPVFAQVMQGALRLLDVPHDAPLEPLELPGDRRRSEGEHVDDAAAEFVDSAATSPRQGAMIERLSADSRRCAPGGGVSSPIPARPPTAAATSPRRSRAAPPRCSGSARASPGTTLAACPTSACDDLQAQAGVARARVLRPARPSRSGWRRHRHQRQDLVHASGSPPRSTRSGNDRR